MILRNAAVTWLGIALNHLLALVLTPFMVAHLGQSGYGVWLLVISITALFGLLDLGVSSALTRFTAMQLAQGDLPAARQTQCVALTFYLFVSLAALAGFAALAWAAPSLFGICGELQRDAQWSLLLVGLATALVFPARAFEGLLLARECHHLVRSVDMAVALLRFGAVLYFLPLGGGVRTMSAIHLAILSLGAALVVGLSLRRIPLGGPPRLVWDWALFKQLLAFGRDIMLMVIGDRARSQLPNVLIGMWSTSLDVAHFGVGARLIQNEATLINHSVGVIQPRFAALKAKQDLVASRELWLRGTLYAGLVAGYLGLGMACLARPFMHLWLGPDFETSARVVWYLIGPITLYLTLRPCDMLLVGHNRHRLSGWVGLAEIGVMMPASLVLVPLLGGEGMALALAGSLLLIRPWVVPRACSRLLELPLWRFWGQGLGRPLLTVALTALVVVPLLAMRSLDTWFELFAALGLYSLVYAPCLWLAGLPRAERELWLERFQGWRQALARGKR